MAVMFCLDPDGIELPDLDAAKREALIAARDTLSHGVREGVLDIRYRIDVEDAEGKILHSLPLCDAYELITT